MTLKLYSRIFLFLLPVLAGCKKETEKLLAPSVFITPAATTAGAGTDATFNLTVTATGAVKRIKITEAYGSQPERTLKDSTLDPPKGSVDEQFLYPVPNSALKDDKIVLTFTVTDNDGRSTVKTGEVTVSNSRPTITVTPETSQAKAGAQVPLHLKLSSPLANITEVSITYRINETGVSALDTLKFENVKDKEQDYTYTMPAQVKPGDYVALVFTVTDADGHKHADSVRINVVQ